MTSILRILIRSVQSDLQFKKFVKIAIRCSVTAITSRSHRGDPGSTPGFGIYPNCMVVT